MAIENHLDAASRFTIENAKVRTFSDFTTNFEKNPRTGYLARVENEEAVKLSIRNLILTERTERFYRPWVGCKINGLLFDPVDDVTSQLLQLTIRETIENNEPRANLLGVNVDPHPELYAYFTDVAFSIISIPDSSFNVSLVLKQLR
jgi:phage baseplate assembly protein W